MCSQGKLLDTQDYEWEAVLGISPTKSSGTRRDNCMSHYREAEMPIHGVKVLGPGDSSYVLLHGWGRTGVGGKMHNGSRLGSSHGQTCRNLEKLKWKLRWIRLLPHIYLPISHLATMSDGVSRDRDKLAQES